ncbi:MAG TPA: M15 family metallopeptidase [Candidatus Obscuribacterales bacterium]
MKPYQHIPIHDEGEPLVPLPLGQFAVVTPHPYVALGAPYGDRSPYWLRQSVVTALHQAQTRLQAMHPGWRLQIFDAYRPIAVQQFMVDYATQMLAADRGLDLAAIAPAQHQALRAEVQQFWAVPSTDPRTPPPHSTGAAVDLTLVDDGGVPVDMGSPIDEISVRSHPNHFQHGTDAASQRIHAHRCLLRDCMVGAGFQQHPQEWWHFSLGDQLWAWQRTQATGHPHPARYGCAEPPGAR